MSCLAQFVVSLITNQDIAGLNRNCATLVHKDLVIKILNLLLIQEWHSSVNGKNGQLVLINCVASLRGYDN